MYSTEAGTEPPTHHNPKQLPRSNIMLLAHTTNVITWPPHRPTTNGSTSMTKQEVSDEGAKINTMR